MEWAPILYQPIEEWGLKFGPQKEEALPREKKICSTAAATAYPLLIDFERFSNINRAIWVVAKLKNIAKNKSFKALNAMLLSTQHLKEAECFVVVDVQKSIECELRKSSNEGKGGHYGKLKPLQDTNGLWVIGEQLTKYNAMTPDSSLQKLLPAKHPATCLFMQCAHQAGHQGRDATLAQFRMHYLGTTWEQTGKISKIELSIVQVARCKIP